jgi:hypothetical protein
MDVDLYPQLDETITELPQDLGLLSPDELEAPGNFTINNIDLSWRRPVFAPFDDRSIEMQLFDLFLFEQLLLHN